MRGGREGGVMLPDEQLSPEQIEVFRRMTPAKRWEAAKQLYWTVRAHKAAFMKHSHPEWTDARVSEEVRRVFLHARS